MEEMKSIESQVLDFWNNENVYKKLKEQLKDKKRFFFLDGPPYATGAIHMGTAWNKIMKDSYIRFNRMQGFNVNDQPGYDTHGLPIENKVEKEIGLNNKSEIENYGISNFIEKCKDFVNRHVELMNGQFKNLAVWMDWDNPYLTMNNSYIEGAWFTFKQAYEKGLLYKGKYPIHVCSHCATALAYTEIEHFTAHDPSIYVKFPIKGEENTHLLIWTTTPWTLFANMGVMVNPSLDYCYVKIDNETVVVAKDLLETITKKAKIENYDIIKEVKGKELVGTKYENPLDSYLNTNKNLSDAYRVIPSSLYVSAGEGTGLVHTAPGHGSEDFKVGQEFNLPVISPVNLDGTYTEEVPEFQGKNVKETNQDIIDLLSSKGYLLHKESITHEYPKCWRCSTPLLQIAVPQWFFRVTAIREKLIEENNKVNWQPSWAGQRFENWLLSLGDWPISRQRYWGIPLPIWECQACETVKVIGSSDELPEKINDLHKPHIDQVTLDCDCGGKMARIPDVLDVWFDAGVAPWSSLGYPRNKLPFEEMFPADLIMEGPDQIRGWWNALMITSILTFDKRSFDNVIFHGFVLDSHGIKMSKSKGNVVQPEEVVNKYGIDITRYYLLSSPPWDDFYFKWEDVEEVKRFFNIFLNTYNFLQTYKESPEKTNLQLEDRWILAKLQELIKSIEKDFKGFNVHRTIKSIENFIINDLSRTYIKLIRDRTWPAYTGEDKKSAFWTLSKVFITLSKLLAPSCPVITEKIYQSLKSEKDPLSVHMNEWPQIEDEFLNTELVKDMKVATDVVEAIAAARQENNLSLRWPILSVNIKGTNETIKRAQKIKDLIIDLGNVKSLNFEVEEQNYEVKLNFRVVGKKFGKDVKKLQEELNKHNPTEIKNTIDKNGEVKVGDFNLTKEDLEFRVKSSEGVQFPGGHLTLDTSETEELSLERLYRELIRSIQETRKQSDLKVEDSIEISIKSKDNFKEFLENNKEDFKKSVGASSVTFEPKEGMQSCGNADYNDMKVEFAFKRV